MCPKKTGGQLPSSNELTIAELDYMVQESQVLNSNQCVTPSRTFGLQMSSFVPIMSGFKLRKRRSSSFIGRVSSLTGGDGESAVTEPEPTPIVQFGNLPSPQLFRGLTSNAMGFPVQGLGCLSTAVTDSPFGNPLPPTSESSIVHSSSTDIVNGNSVVHLSRGKGIINGSGSSIHEGDCSGPSKFMNDACKIGDR